MAKKPHHRVSSFTDLCTVIEDWCDGRFRGQLSFWPDGDTTRYRLEINSDGAPPASVEVAGDGSFAAHFVLSLGVARGLTDAEYVAALEDMSDSERAIFGED